MSISPKLASDAMEKVSSGLQPHSDSFDRSTTSIKTVPIPSIGFDQAPSAHEQTNTAEADAEAKRVRDEELRHGLPMHGVVHNLKHAYGFVRCDETGERIFFHYSEIDAKSIESLDPVPVDHPPVIIGDVVQFIRVTDTPTGKQKAVNIQVLSRPTCPSLFVKTHDDHHVDPKVGHQDGDDAEHKSVVSSHREEGVVVSIKQNYGFIKCAERDHKQVFFHYSEMAPVGSDGQPVDIQPGLEVAFYLSPTSSGRVVAVRIQALSPGTISFFSIKSSVLYGVIKSGLESSHASSQKTRRRARPSSNDTGFLTLPAKERARAEHVKELQMGVDSVLGFTGADVKYPGIKLLPGDQVGFRLKLDRRTQTLSATEIFLVRCAPTGRKQGIITIWKDMYGFLKLDGKRDQMFVHVNEFIEKSHQPMVGDEIEFNVAPDNHGQENAIRISVLPKGTVQLNDDRILGVVIEKPAIVYPAMLDSLRRAVSDQHGMSSAFQAPDTAVVYGTIRLLHDKNDLCGGAIPETEESPEEGFVRFMLADLEDGGSSVRVGDIVSVVVAPAPKFQRASNIRQCPKIGMVSDIAQNQIVIKVEGNQYCGSELFEFLCDDKTVKDAIHIRDLVEIHDFESGISPISMRIARRMRSLSSPTNAGSIVGLPGHPSMILSGSCHSNQKPTLKKSVSLDLSPSSYRRWDLRLQPRNWS